MAQQKQGSFSSTIQGFFVSAQAFSEQSARKTCSLLCFRGNSREGFLTAAFCYIFSTAEDINVFSQETVPLFLLWILLLTLHFMRGRIFSLRCVWRAKPKKSSSCVSDVTACYLPWQHSSLLTLLHVSTRVKHPRAAWWAITGTWELSPDCNFGYYSFLVFSSPSASQRAIACPGRECPRLPDTEMLCKCVAWDPFLCKNTTVRPGHLSACQMCKLMVNKGWDSVWCVRQDLLCSWRWAHTALPNPQKLISFSQWFFSTCSVVRPRLMGTGENGRCCL